MVEALGCGLEGVLYLSWWCHWVGCVDAKEGRYVLRLWWREEVTHSGFRRQCRLKDFFEVPISVVSRLRPERLLNEANWSEEQSLSMPGALFCEHPHSNFRLDSNAAKISSPSHHMFDYGFCPSKRWIIQHGAISGKASMADLVFQFSATVLPSLSHSMTIFCKSR